MAERTANLERAPLEHARVARALEVVSARVTTMTICARGKHAVHLTPVEGVSGDGWVHALIDVGMARLAASAGMRKRVGCELHMCND